MDPQMIGDENVERLLASAYAPESVPPEFAARLAATLSAAAKEQAARRASSKPAPRPWPRRKLFWAAVAAGSLAATLLLGYAITRHYSDEPKNEIAQENHQEGRTPNTPRKIRPAFWTGDLTHGLTPRQPAAAPKTAALKPGTTVVTKPGERRLLTLGDGSRLFVNAGSEVNHPAPRRLVLKSGEIYVEVAPQAQAPRFVVTSGGRAVTATGTHFAVRADGERPGVVVTQGTVAVEGVKGVVTAGRQVVAGASDIVAAPRTSHLLDWTRELLAAAESPLVPDHQHAGGALIAVDPQGQEVNLTLRRYIVDVHIEDGFARTTIDQTYFNNRPDRLEGTFYFPLPPDASLSRLAMYVFDGNNQCRLMEGGMAERQHAANVYETIRYQRRDPALLEWLDGSTFKMRVFPLEGWQEKRILLSYTQRLPSLYGNLRYRFPGGHTMQFVRDWSFSARIKGGAGLRVLSPSHPNMQFLPHGPDLIATDAARGVKPERDVVLEVQDRNAFVNDDLARFAGHLHDGKQYLMLRYRPRLPASPRRERRDWIVLFEASASRDPLLAGTQAELLRHLLRNAEHDDTFTLLTANAHVHVFDEKPRPVTAKNLAEAEKFLAKTHLIGALDLAQAFQAAAFLARQTKQPYLLHLGAGIPSMGERDAVKLAAALPENLRYVGVGVGKRWNRTLMKQAAERSAGHYTQVSPDEVLAWRAFDLLATLNTPRLLDVRVTDAAEKATFLTETSLLAQGEELCAVTRVDPKTGAIPGKVIVSGKLDGKPFTRSFAVQHVLDGAGYLPRTWGKLEIDRLLRAGAQANKAAIISLSRELVVMSPFTSLLVLETDADYQRYNVDRGRKDHWAPYACPEKVPLVHGPGAGDQPQAVRPGSRPTVSDVLTTLLLNRSGATLPCLDAMDPLLMNNFDPTAPEIDYDETIIRVEDVTVSGTIDPNEAVGIVNGKATVNLTRWSAPSLLIRKDKLPREEKQLRMLRDEAWKFSRTLIDEKLSSPIKPFEDLQLKRKVLRSSEDLVRLSGGRKSTRRLIRNLGNQTYTDSTIKLPETSSYTTHAKNLIDGRLFEDIPPLAGVGVGNGLTRREPPAEGYWPLARPAAGMPSSSMLIYTRQPLELNARFFGDLVRFAPGLHNSRADVLAVLEAEADVAVARRGTIEPAARKLIDRARAAGWETVTYPADGPLAGYVVHVNGRGSMAFERVLSSGLTERVVCDGETLWHLYPEIGLAARRRLSRHHAAELRTLAPWLMPDAVELARKGDVRVINASTVAVIPFDVKQVAAHVELHLTFASRGHLAERRLVEMPAKKLIARQTFGTDGTIRLFDGAGKILSEQKRPRTQSAAPALRPDVKGLVVLALPLRTGAYLSRLLVNAAIGLKMHDADELAAALASDCLSEQSTRARTTFQSHFHAQGDRRLGLYVLLSAAGIPIEQGPVSAAAPFRFDFAAAHPESPLAAYLAHHHRHHGRIDAPPLERVPGPRDGFLARLVEVRNLWSRWASGQAKNDAANLPHDRARTLAYFQKATSPLFALALLGAMEKQGGQAPNDHMLGALVERFGLICDPRGMGYALRYEHARSLWQAGKGAQAYTLFRALHADALKRNMLPPIDAQFRGCLLHPPEGQPNYAALQRAAVAGLLKEGRYAMALLLVRQARALGDGPLADDLQQTILERVDAPHQVAVNLAIVDELIEQKQFARAEQLVVSLQARKELIGRSELWRVRATIAEGLGQRGRAVACLEKALAIEFRTLPEIINLDEVRADYRMLLTHYQAAADALALLGSDAPTELPIRIVRAADRWRLLEPESAEACRLAGKALRTLGKAELAWRYWTTPIDFHPEESKAWSELATILQGEGDLDQADRALARACEAEPTNPDLLWRRAQNLQQLGRGDDARELYRRIAEGSWQERFRAIQTQARQLLNVR